MGSLDPLPAGRTGIRARCPSSPGPLVAGACGHVLHAQKGRLHGKRGSASHRKSKIPIALRPRRAPRADRHGRAVQPPCSLAGLHGTQRGGRRPGPGPARASEPRRLKAGPEQAPASVREAEAVAVPVDAGPAVPTGSFDDSVPPHTRTPRPEEVERQAHGPQLVRRAAAATGSACGGRSLLADRWRSQRVQGTTARPGADASRPRARACASARTWRACGPRCGAGRTPLSVSANLGGSGRKLQGRLARSAPLARTPAPSGQLPPGLHGPGRARLPRRGGLACLWELCDPDPSPLAQRLSQVTCEAHTCCGALAQALPPPTWPAPSLGMAPLGRLPAPHARVPSPRWVLISLLVARSRLGGDPVWPGACGQARLVQCPEPRALAGAQAGRVVLSHSPSSQGAALTYPPGENSCFPEPRRLTWKSRRAGRWGSLLSEEEHSVRAHTLGPRAGGGLALAPGWTSGRSLAVTRALASSSGPLAPWPLSTGPVGPGTSCGEGTFDRTPGGRSPRERGRELPRRPAQPRNPFPPKRGAPGEGAGQVRAG